MGEPTPSRSLVTLNCFIATYCLRSDATIALLTTLIQVIAGLKGQRVPMSAQTSK